PSQDPAVRARAQALVAEVELARGDTLAAQLALDATPERVQPDVALARAEVGLARRAPADVVAGELASLARRLGESAHGVRALALVDEWGVARGVPAADAAKALERTADAVQDASAAAALRALAGLARGGAPRSALGVLEGAKDVAAARERGALELFAARVSTR